MPTNQKKHSRGSVSLSLQMLLYTSTLFKTNVIMRETTDKKKEIHDSIEKQSLLQNAFVLDTTRMDTYAK